MRQSASLHRLGEDDHRGSELYQVPKEIGRVPLDKVEGFVKGRDVLSGE
jgi:hypothetical protein